MEGQGGYFSRLMAGGTVLLWGLGVTLGFLAAIAAASFLWPIAQRCFAAALLSMMQSLRASAHADMSARVTDQ
jgi:hypothetical protein